MNRVLTLSAVVAMIAAFAPTRASGSMISAVNLTLATNSKLTLRVQAASGAITVTGTTSATLSGSILTTVGCYDDPIFGQVPDLFGIDSMDVSMSDASLRILFAGGLLGRVDAYLTDIKLDGTGPIATGTVVGTGTSRFDLGGTTLGIVEGDLSYEGFGLIGAGIGSGFIDFDTAPQFAEFPTGSTLAVVETPTVDPEKFVISVNLPINASLGEIITDPLVVSATVTGLISASGIKMITIAPPQCIEGDVDCDGDVDFQDFLMLQVGYGITIDAERSDGDLDDDGDVDFQDFLVLQANYGNSSDAFGGGDGLGASAVPEPGAILLLVIGVLGLVPIVRSRLAKRS